MQLPQRAIGLAFPGQGYMRRRRQARLDGLRRVHQLPQPVRLTAEEARQNFLDGPAAARAQAVLDRQTARTSSTERDQAGLLHAKAAELARSGSAQISCAGGEIVARLVRRRWGGDVLDISRSRAGGEASGRSVRAVPRSPGPARTAAITSALADALAATEPPAGPAGTGLPAGSAQS